MLGTFGEKTTSLHDLILELAEKKLNTTLADKRPFTSAEFCSPGFVVGENENQAEIAFGENGAELRCFYPFCNRVTAGLILLNLHKRYAPKFETLTDSNSLDITLKFVASREIFPAQHIWEDIQSIIICSVGHTDRRSADEDITTAIFDAMPAALVLQKEYDLPTKNGNRRVDLSRSLKRIQHHFDNDWMKKKTSSNHIEKWSRKTDGAIEVVNICKLWEDKVLLNLIEKQLQKKQTKSYRSALTNIKHFIDTEINNSNKNNASIDFDVKSLEKLLLDFQIVIEKSLNI